MNTRVGVGREGKWQQQRLGGGREGMGKKAGAGTAALPKGKVCVGGGSEGTAEWYI